MLSMFDPSLLDLVPCDQSSWSKGNYWLGGQIKMHLTDKITDELLKKVQQRRIGKHLAVKAPIL